MQPAVSGNPRVVENVGPCAKALLFTWTWYELVVRGWVLREAPLYLLPDACSLMPSGALYGREGPWFEAVELFDEG
jgi:hypothetical protein